MLEMLLNVKVSIHRNFRTDLTVLFSEINSANITNRDTGYGQFCSCLVVFPLIAVFCLIWIIIYIRVPETTSYKQCRAHIISVLGNRHVKVIWHNLAKSLPNMGVVALRGPEGSLSVNCYLKKTNC